jgi:hypothetical protein
MSKPLEGVYLMVIWTMEMEMNMEINENIEN